MIQRDHSGESFRAPWQVFWVAFAVRVLYLTLAHTYRIHPQDDHMLFGQEMGRIARALATGFGFSDPFRGHTGPTAWVGPLYPLILAGVFKLFGVFTAQSAWVILTINSLFSALTARTTWEIAERCFNRNVARWSAWIWALYPAAMQYAVRWVWDTSLTTFLFSWVLVVALRMRSPDPPGLTSRRWALLGLLWGLTGLSNPALLIFLPVCGLWVLAGAGRRQTGGVLLAAALFLACLGPVDLEELGGLPPFHAHARKFRRRALPGQRTWLNWAVDGVRPSYPGARSIAPVCRDGRGSLFPNAWGSGHGGDPRRSRLFCPKYAQAGLFLLGRRSPPHQPNRMGGVRAQFKFHICQRLWAAGIGFGDTAPCPGRRVFSRGPSC